MLLGHFLRFPHLLARLQLQTTPRADRVEPVDIVTVDYLWARPRIDRVVVELRAPEQRDAWLALVQFQHSNAAVDRGDEQERAALNGCHLRQPELHIKG